jgi:hypothetical protein
MPRVVEQIRSGCRGRSAADHLLQLRHVEGDLTRQNGFSRRRRLRAVPVFWSLAARERNLRSSSATRGIPLYCATPNGLQRAVVSTPESSDTHFFHSFSIVLGLLIAFTILLFGFARVLGKEQNAEQLDDPLVKNAAPQNTITH